MKHFKMYINYETLYLNGEHTLVYRPTVMLHIATLTPHESHALEEKLVKSHIQIDVLGYMPSDE